MCGIVGLVEPGRSDLEKVVVRMRDTLAHRGPDGQGVEVWPEAGAALGHRRLSIIDLSEAGHEPMPNETGDVWLVFNGEIYNFRSLRGELERLGHRFRSRTDSEVILHAYEEWGTESVERLQGMFAYAIWDLPRRRLLLARDRLGIKPLYYYRDDRRFLFASEPKAILAHPDAPRRIHRPAVVDYLSYGYVPGERSIFESLRKLLPGHLLILEDGGIQIRRYWHFEPRPAVATDPDGPEETAEELGPLLREHLTRAVGDQLVADVPLGAFLSGGIDSSLITALMRRAGAETVRTVSVGFDRGSSELPYARQVAERWQTDHSEEWATLAGTPEVLSRLALCYDEPFADVSSLPTFELCRHARRRVKVALSGDGGDELFAGYRWYGFSLRRQSSVPPLAPTLRALIQRLRGGPRLARLPMFLRRLERDPVARHGHLVGLFDGWERRRLLGSALWAERAATEPEEDYPLFRAHFRGDLPLLTALQWLDLKTFLVDDILVKVDRASMAHALEVRPPFLDHRVVELAFRIPAGLQHRQNEGKAFLKQTCGDLLPETIRQRGKRGFSPPITAWFKDGLWGLAQERLLRGHCVRDGLLDGGFIRWMVDNYTERRWSKVWSLWMLEEWYRHWQPS